jgi:hypothetical protein
MQDICRGSVGPLERPQGRAPRPNSCWICKYFVSKQCACSRRVHIEGHLNRFEYCHPTIILITIVLGLFLVKKSYLCRLEHCYQQHLPLAVGLEWGCTWLVFRRLCHPEKKDTLINVKWNIKGILSTKIFIFLSESVKVRFIPRVDTFSFAQEPHAVYCF